MSAVAKFDYSRMRESAVRLIDRFGQMYTFTRQTGEQYDPATGTTTSTSETFDFNSVWVDFSKDEVDGTVILNGDVRILVDGLLKVDDRVVRNGKEWRIVNAEEINPGDTFLMTEAQARR